MRIGPGQRLDPAPGVLVSWHPTPRESLCSAGELPPSYAKAVRSELFLSRRRSASLRLLIASVEVFGATYVAHLSSARYMQCKAGSSFLEIYRPHTAWHTASPIRRISNFVPTTHGEMTSATPDSTSWRHPTRFIGEAAHEKRNQDSLCLSCHGMI